MDAKFKAPYSTATAARSSSKSQGTVGIDVLITVTPTARVIAALGAAFNRASA